MIRLIETTGETRVKYTDTHGMLGKSLKVYLKTGTEFYFKVLQAEKDYIHGYDDESLNLSIHISDLDFVMVKN